MVVVVWAGLALNSALWPFEAHTREGWLLAGLTTGYTPGRAGETPALRGS